MTPFKPLAPFSLLRNVMGNGTSSQDSIPALKVDGFLVLVDGLPIIIS